MLQKHKEDEEFYTSCAEILGVEHEYRTPLRRNRWTARRLGNGRFPGFGLIRLFGHQVIITSRFGTKHFPSREAALTHLREYQKNEA